MTPISRADALAAGQKTYFTGVPCKHGHVSERRVVDHTCTECRRSMTRNAKDAKKFGGSLCEVSLTPHRQWQATMRAARRQRLRAFRGCDTMKRVLAFEKAERDMARTIERELIKSFAALPRGPMAAYAG